MITVENVQPNLTSRLDRLSISDSELSKAGAEEYVADYYQHIVREIDQHKNVKPESGYIECDVFVEKATGMVYQLLLIPSNLTKEVPWTVAQIGMKPEGGVDKYIKLNQKDRRNRFGECILRAQAIHYLDHGYGAGIPAEKCVVDGLATGELPPMNSGDLFVMLMTKGSGGTYSDPKIERNREKLPEYDMDATYAQLAEATHGIDGYLANTVRDYYLRYPIFSLDRKPQLTSKHEMAKALLDIAELKAGTWASNRGVSMVGHSMGGWEAIRAYLGDVFGRFTIGMEKYRDHLTNSFEQSKKVYADAYQQIMEGIQGNDRIWMDGAIERISSNRDIFSGADGPSKIILKDFEHKIGTIILREILNGARPNLVYEALTPLIKGEKLGGGRVSNIVDERHTLLTSFRHAPELRLLIGIRKSLGKLGGVVGYRLGKWMKLVDKGVRRLVEDSAYGVNLIRATHTVGLEIGLDAVIMDDQVLRDAKGMSQDTIAQHSVKKVMTIEEGGQRGTISRLRIHAGGSDPVLDPRHMKQDAVDMITGREEQLGDLFVMHDDGSHYLPKNALSQVWGEIFSRRNAVVEHRKQAVDIIARSFNVTI